MAQISIQGSPVQPGERVVYPNGGICRVKGVESKQIAGMTLLMLMLEREEDGATVMVPEGKVGSIGLRKVATADAIKVLFEYLTHSSADPELDWKVRHRDNFEKMAAGGLLDTAEVLKGLHALALLRPLPQREREMYDSARHQLVGEIAAALNLPPAVAENNIDYALTPPPGSGRVAPKDQPLDLKSLRRAGPRRAATGTDDEGFEEDEDTEATDLGLGDEAEEKDEDTEEQEETHGDVDEASAPAAAAPAAKKTTSKKTSSKKAPAKTATEKKPAAAKAAAKKSTEAKPAAKKASVKKATEAKPAEKKPAAARAPAKKVVAKKTAAKKAPATTKAASSKSVSSKSVPRTAVAKKAPAKKKGSR